MLSILVGTTLLLILPCFMPLTVDWSSKLLTCTCCAEHPCKDITIIPLPHKVQPISIHPFPTPSPYTPSPPLPHTPLPHTPLPHMPCFCSKSLLTLDRPVSDLSKSVCCLTFCLDFLMTLTDLAIDFA